MTKLKFFNAECPGHGDLGYAFKIVDQPPLMDEEEHRQVPVSQAEVLPQKAEQEEE